MAELRSFLLSATSDAPSPSIADVARTAEMSDVYETIYRDLCDRAAHPSLSSLLRHVTQDAEGNIVGLRFGPETAETQNVILAMMTALFPSVHGLGTIFPMEDDCTHEFNACWAAYARLLGEDCGFRRAGLTIGTRNRLVTRPILSVPKSTTCWTMQFPAGSL
jgi:hypothetical protein